MRKATRNRRARPVFAVAAIAAGIAGGIAAADGGAKKAGGDGLVVCAKPSDRCDSPVKRFAPYELPLRLPSRLTDNVPYRSAQFYGVVLRRDPDPACDGGEYTKATDALRKKIQARFPDRKVFADQQCPDMGAVSYEMDGQPNTRAFVAVYAGKTEAEAKPVLSKAKADYPGAQLRKMRVVFERIMQ